MIITKEIEIPDAIYVKDNMRLEIYRDNDPISPHNNDNAGYIVTSHRRYCLGDEQVENIDEWLTDYKEECGDDILCVLPLYLYDHSGITINTTGFNCPWDSSRIGYIIMLRSRMENLGWSLKDINEDVAKKIALAEVEDYNMYLTGQVWRYVLYDNNDSIDSCDSIYGEYTTVFKYIEENMDTWERVENDEKEL